MSKSKIVFLSDIHIGSNSPTVWYQKDLHEPYLRSILDWVISNASDIRELVFLGDVVDFWTYPCEQIPPSFHEIMKAHPNIFGNNDEGTYGKLSDVLTALDGKVSYVRGNHDMTITQEDLNEIKNPQGYKITLQDDIYFPLGKDNPKLVCTHGHQYTIFNKPYMGRDEKNDNPVAPLPLGFYITRSVASMRYKEIIDEKGNFRNENIKSVADLENSGDPNGMGGTMVQQTIQEIMNKWSKASIAHILLDAISNKTGVQPTQEIKLADRSPSSFEEAKRTYENLVTEWIKHELDNSEDEQSKDNKLAELSAVKSALADLDGSYMGWFAQRLAFQTGANLVVMGHTHKPILGLEKSSIGYVNTGFHCPSRPDIGKKHPTFIVVDCTKITPDKGTVADCAEILQIMKGASNPQRYPAELAKVSEGILNVEGTKKLSQDCSCYVEIDNTNGSSDLIREDYGKKHGHYVVAPPKMIARGEIVKFWLQDPPTTEFLTGAGAEEGWVKYRKNDGEIISFKYSCPYGITLNPKGYSNKCSVEPKNNINFLTKADGCQDWDKPNGVETSGHPFFIKFVL